MKQEKKRRDRPQKKNGGWARSLAATRAGQLIRVWIVPLLAVAVWLICVPGAARLYWAGFNALLNAWGVTERNVTRAPWFVRLLVRYSGVVLSVAQSALLLAASGRIIRWKRLSLPENGRRRAARTMGRGALMGAVTLLSLWALTLLADNMRLGRPLLRPAWSANTAVIPLLAALSAAAALRWGVALTFRFLRGRTPLAVAAAVSALLLAAARLYGEAPGVMPAVNALLCGALCCLSDEKEGSLGWALGFLWTVRTLEQAVLGFPGCAAALLETYPVNYYWFNGGESGLWHGAAWSLALLANLLCFIPRRKRKSAS